LVILSFDLSFFSTTLWSEVHWVFVGSSVMGNFLIFVRFFECRLTRRINKLFGGFLNFLVSFFSLLVVCTVITMDYGGSGRGTMGAEGLVLYNIAKSDAVKVSGRQQQGGRMSSSVFHLR
jgi:hypothetical protein